jgi:hypothetical protein|tara:strand:- start:1563 stop:2135 length:573 start_codon:yes stop_codon:yes gene_type:complete
MQMSWLLRTIPVTLTALYLTIFLSLTASANDTLSKENKLKAAYFLNFIKFIEWPNNSGTSRLTPIFICLQDATPFEGFFRNLTSDKSVTNSMRHVQIRQLSDATHCDMTYLYHTASGENSQIEGSVVVSDSDQILQKNSAITFYIEERRLRFEIDLNNIQKSGVTVSSELLKLARIKQGKSAPTKTLSPL